MRKRKWIFAFDPWAWSLIISFGGSKEVCPWVRVLCFQWTYF